MQVDARMFTFDDTVAWDTLTNAYVEDAMTPDFASRPTGRGGTPVEQPPLSQIEAAAERCRDVVVRTPLVPLHRYEAESPFWLKPEILQPTRS